MFVGLVIVLTIVFGYFSFQTKFDANMSNINYMTDDQKADMAYFQKMMTENGDYQKVYTVTTDSTMDGALDKSQQPMLDRLVKEKLVHDYNSCSQFLVSTSEQKHRLRRWNNFCKKNRENSRRRFAQLCRGKVLLLTALMSIMTCWAENINRSLSLISMT